jgi:hypothetical protein
MKRTLGRAVAVSLVWIVSGTMEPLLVAQQSAPSTQAPPATGAQSNDSGQYTPPVELPDNPGRGQSPQDESAAPPPAQSSPTQTTTKQPSGTAVAPPVQISGGAASKPAGVAIAPPKQRQVRSLLIKLGVLAGAGVAIGTVVGLSAASPSRVPGSPGH